MKTKMESQISLLKAKALSINDEKILSLIYNLELSEYVDENLTMDYNIIFSQGTDLELLEFISRFLVKIKFQLLNEKTIILGIKNTPEPMREYLDWFIKFFGYLESTELGNEFSLNKNIKEVFENKFTTYKFDLENLKFAIEKIEIEFR